MSKMTDSIEAWLLSFECGKTWFSTITAPRTKEMYSKSLKQYCDAVGKTPDELLELKVEGIRNVGTAKEFQAEKLLDNYLYNNLDVTIHIRISLLCAVKSFYKENWRELNKKVGEKLTLPPAKKRTPAMQDLLEMDEAMMYQRDKAILWFLESAPFRVGTLTKLTEDDLKPTQQLLKENRETLKSQVKRTLEEDQQIAKLVPYYIEVKADRMKGAGQGKYVGAKQIAFLHHYAVEKLEKYKLELKKRGIVPKPNSKLFLAYTNNPYNKGKGDTLKNIGVIFTNACAMAWNDENKKFSPQDMRDFLQSALEKVEVNPNLVSPLLSHKVKGVDKHYSNHDIVEFLQVFVKVLPLLIPQTIEEVKAESEMELSKQETALTHLQYENNDLKDKINHVRTEVKEQDATQKEEIKALKDHIRDIYQYTNKRLDPLLDVIDELSKTPEGAEALRKLRANKIAQREEEYAKARESEAEMDAKAIEEYEKSKAED